MMFVVELMQNFIYIVQGYSIWLYNKITGKSSEIAKKRLDICNKCEHNKNGVCDICGCILKAKVRAIYPIDDFGISIEGCPERKW